jgi:hypothetical protein
MQICWDEIRSIVQSLYHMAAIFALISGWIWFRKRRAPAGKAELQVEVQHARQKDGSHVVYVLAKVINRGLVQLETDLLDSTVRDALPKRIISPEESDKVYNSAEQFGQKQEVRPVDPETNEPTSAKLEPGESRSMFATHVVPPAVETVLISVTGRNANERKHTWGVQVVHDLRVQASSTAQGSL